MKANDIYKLELHERLYIDNSCFMVRVPGGWIYVFDNCKVFVPYNNEFYKSNEN